MRHSFGKKFFIFSLAFLILPSVSVSRSSHSLFLDFPIAKADDFKSLNDQMGGQRIQELAVACNFVDRISAVMTVLNQSAAIMANGAAVSITATANVIPTVCNMVMAILSAKNLDGVLRAARMANRMAQTGHETSLDFIEDSVDLAISLDEFGKSKASFVDKALNAGMYAKVLNYSFDYTSLQRASSLNRETGVVGGRQTQLIDDMKTNNTCTELTAVGKAEAASKAKKKKGRNRVSKRFDS